VPNFNYILLALQLYTSAQTSAFRNARLSLDTTQTYILQIITNRSFTPIHILNCTCEMPSTCSQQVTSQGFKEWKNKIWRFENEVFPPLLSAAMYSSRG
jgi:hypothetical protein